MNAATAGLLLVLIAAGCVSAVRRALLWRTGKSAAVAWWSGLLRLPRSYMVDVHHIVARDPYAARMHIAAAGGFVAALLLLLLVHLAQLSVFSVPLLACLALMFAGAVAVARRRFPHRPARLSGGPWNRLTAALLCFSSGFFILTLPAAGISTPLPAQAVGFLFAAFGGSYMLSNLSGPMRHAFAGALNLVCHPRPARLGAARPMSALRVPSLDLAATAKAGEVLGANAATDFAWNRLLNFDACVQCGRCEAACPAFASGQPLNPKKLVQDLIAGFAGPATEQLYSGSPHPGVTGRRAIGDRYLQMSAGIIPSETLWSCMTCRACVQECPMLIEHVDAVVDLRRYQVMEAGAVPERTARMLERVRETDTACGRAPAERLDWAVDLALPLARPGTPVEVLLWLGEGAFDLRYQRTLRALITVLRKAGTRFAVLEQELDCGDTARRLGDEATFQALAWRNIEILSRYAFSEIVTADPHAYHCLRNEYPALGGDWTVRHHTAFLNDLVQSGKLSPNGSVGVRITYHDPCYLGRYNGETDAPRRLLAGIGVDLLEMERSGMRSLCCGGGGGAPLADIPGKRRIPDMRMEQAVATGAEIVVVACPNCTTMLEGVIGPRPQVFDVAEIVLSSLEPSQ